MFIESIKNSKFVSFLLNIFIQLFLFNGKSKVFSVIIKIFFIILTIMVSILLLNNGLEKNTSLLDLFYIKNLIFILIQKNNPVTPDLWLPTETLYETMKQVLNNKKLMLFIPISFNVIKEIRSLPNYDIVFFCAGFGNSYNSNLYENLKLIPEKFMSGFHDEMVKDDYLLFKFFFGIINSLTAISIENYVMMLCFVLSLKCYFYFKLKGKEDFEKEGIIVLEE